MTATRFITFSKAIMMQGTQTLTIMFKRSYPESSVADPGPNLDPDPLVRRMDPDPDPSSLSKISKKNFKYVQN